MINKPILVILVALIQGTLASCEKVLPKKTSNKSSKGSHIIDLEKPLNLDRIEDREKAHLSFYTMIESNCEIKYWALDPSQKPSVKDAIVVPCANKKPSSEIFLTIDKLDAKTLYRFQVYAWPEEKAKSDYDPLPFDEIQGGHTFLGKKKATGEIIIASADLPLGTASIHRHELAKPFDPDEIKEALKRPIGCFTEKQETKRYEKNTAIIRVESVASRGYATGTGKPWLNREDRLRIEFQKRLQPGDQWEWNYRYHNESLTFTLKPPPTFDSPHVESKDLRILDDSNFDKNLKVMNLDSTVPLRLSWKASKSKNPAYVHVQLGHSSLAASIYCTFDAATEAATIEPKFLQKLPKGSHYLLMTLEHAQLQSFGNKPAPSWLVTTYDWRSMKVEKL